MPDWLIGLLFAAAMLALMAWVTWWERRDPGPYRPRPEGPAVCAWCKWRAGEDCTHPKSPAGAGPIGEVCAGRVKCKVRETIR